MYKIAALYHFTHFEDPEALRGPLLDLCRAHRVSGLLLLAKEGINGTIAGSDTAIERVVSYIRDLPGCEDLSWKESHAPDQPFRRLKVRVKQEIVTMGQPDVDPSVHVGQYIPPSEWNALISAPDVAVIDTRNDFEVAIGSFEGAVNPRTVSFRDFPDWWQANKKTFAGKRIAMFCTGGIRCEKSTNYLLSQGVKDVCHLQGGILKYLEEVPEEDSLWRGACFVFDGRVSVGHGLRQGPHLLCHACRNPILPEDRLKPEYEAGVACHLCASETSEEDKKRFRERQKQMALSEARGEQHVKMIYADGN